MRAVGWESPDPTADGLWRCQLDTTGPDDIILIILLFLWNARCNQNFG